MEKNSILWYIVAAIFIGGGTRERKKSLMNL
jgi:hypothetical protein